jgi:hypothetical protein
VSLWQKISLMMPSFSLPLVQQMVEAAAAAYVHSTVSDPRTNARANVTLDPAGNIIVAFKGSSEPVDFLQDAKFGLRLDPAFKVLPVSYRKIILNKLSLDPDPAIKVLPCQSGIGLSYRKIILNGPLISHEATKPRNKTRMKPNYLSVPAVKIKPRLLRAFVASCAIPAVKVHTGFLEDFNAIKDAVIGQVRKYTGSRPVPGVFITGHSLGGALAILCALECWRQALPVSGVFTFGQPRVGNAAFAALYDRTRMINGTSLCDITFRVVNQNDIVPRTPGLLLGYRHGGTELFLPAGLDDGISTGWQLNPGPWRRAWSDLLGLYWAWRHRRDVLVSEHFLSAYCRRIHALNQN